VSQPQKSDGVVKVDDRYFGTPWLTAFANFCLVVGVFVGVYAVIFLLGALHKGFGAYWGLMLILAIDLAVNLVVQTVRRRRRRRLHLKP
jgi:hypothetical protein